MNNHVFINAPMLLSPLLTIRLNFSIAVIYANSLVSLTALVCGGYCFRYLDGQARLVCKVVLLSLIFDLGGMFWTSRHISNHWWFNMYIPVNASMLLAVISKIRLRSGILKFIPYASASIIVFWLLNVWQTDIYHLANWAYVYSCIVISVFYFAAMFAVAKEYDGSLLRHPFYWLSFGVVLYFGTSVPLFGLMNLILQHYPGIALALFLYAVNFLNVIYHLLITISFIVYKLNGVKATNNSL